MTDNIVKLYTKNAAENPDHVLEQAVGCYDSVVIVGIDKDGEFSIRASTNLTHAEVTLLHVKAVNFLAQFDGIKD